MLEVMNGMEWPLFCGRERDSFSFGILSPFTFARKGVTGSAAQFNIGVSVAPPSCAQTNDRVS